MKWLALLVPLLGACFDFDRFTHGGDAGLDQGAAAGVCAPPADFTNLLSLTDTTLEKPNFGQWQASLGHSVAGWVDGACPGTTAARVCPMQIGERYPWFQLTTASYTPKLVVGQTYAFEALLKVERPDLDDIRIELYFLNDTTPQLALGQSPAVMGQDWIRTRATVTMPAGSTRIQLVVRPAFLSSSAVTTASNECFDVDQAWFGPP
jgi:hypothetical protein